MLLKRTLRFTRRNLPHWEVEGGRYFITVRCADSLPREVVARLDEIHRQIAAIEPASAQFATEQRRYFALMEKYLHAGYGSCPLREGSIAQAMIGEFRLLAEWDIEVPHFTIMPNH